MKILIIFIILNMLLSICCHLIQSNVNFDVSCKNKAQKIALLGYTALCGSIISRILRRHRRIVCETDTMISCTYSNYYLLGLLIN